MSINDDQNPTCRRHCWNSADPGDECPQCVGEYDLDAEESPDEQEPSDEDREREARSEEARDTSYRESMHDAGRGRLLR